MEASSGVARRTTRAPASLGPQKVRGRAARGVGWLVAAPVFIFLAIPTLVVVPMALTPRSYLEFPPSGLSLRPIQAFFEDPLWVSAAGTSLQAAGMAVVISLAVATTAALAMHQSRFRGRGVMLAFILVPLLLPLIVLALAFFLFFSQYRLVGTPLAIGLAHSVLAAPYAYLAIEASLAGHDPALAQSARSLGAGRFAVFRHAYLPAIRPGLAIGALFAFAVSMDEAIVALFLQGPEAMTLPVKMFQDIQYSQSPTIAAAAALLVAVATVVFFLQLLLVIRRRAAGRGGLEGR